MATFGFIGTGNMGGALARAARKRLSGGEILLANRSAAKAEALAQELDCRAVDNAAVAAEADYIFLGVKPYMVAGLMEKIGPVLAARKDRFVLVSMAAALTIPDLRERGCGDWPLIRIMPNTPLPSGRA
ncbi:MAG: pyrroline-5-carboxylate reductase family protein [Dysosmobacter welbionis]